MEVIQLVAKGLRNKEIGSVLGLSEETIKVHVKNILAKFQVTDRTAAVNIAHQRGIIQIG
jgi:two-component system NarL family response regulator